MLQLMRKHAKYFYVLFVIIILSFIFWGVGGVDQGSSRVPLAEIGDEVITVQQYWTAYERSLELYRSVYGTSFNPEAVDLKAKVLDEMVNKKLLLIAAGEAGLSVSDAELEESILNDPAFQRGGAFNRDVYIKTLELNRLTTTSFEAGKREELLVIKMSRFITEVVELTPAETEGLSTDAQSSEQVLENLLERKKDGTIKSYLNGVIKRVPVTINRQLIS